MISFSWPMLKNVFLVFLLIVAPDPAFSIRLCHVTRTNRVVTPEGVMQCVSRIFAEVEK